MPSAMQYTNNKHMHSKVKSHSIWVSSPDSFNMVQYIYFMAVNCTITITAHSSKILLPVQVILTSVMFIESLTLIGRLVLSKMSFSCLNTSTSTVLISISTMYSYSCGSSVGNSARLKKIKTFYWFNMQYVKQNYQERGTQCFRLK